MKQSSCERSGDDDGSLKGGLKCLLKVDLGMGRGLLVEEISASFRANIGSICTVIERSKKDHLLEVGMDCSKSFGLLLC